jgi:hypothetical protein
MPDGRRFAVAAEILWTYSPFSRIIYSNFLSGEVFMLKYPLALVLILISAFFGFLLGRNDGKIETNIRSATEKTDLNADLLKLLDTERIDMLKTWTGEGNKRFFGVIRNLDTPFDEDAFFKTHQEFGIYDETGKSVFVFKDFIVHSFDFAHLQPDGSSIVVTSNGGGTDNLLTVVEYENGGFREQKTDDDFHFRGGWWMMPEYRSGNEGSYFKPAQMFVIQQIGGSDSRPNAAVFRNKDKRFQKVGEISMRDLGDEIERQLTENKK